MTRLPADLQKGERVRLTISSLAAGGDGVSKDFGMPVFVKRVAAGDQVEAEIFDVRKDFARARVIEVIERSPLRAEPPCKLFKVCGGCQWQHMSYEAQVEAKEDIVRQSVKHLGGLDPAIVLPALRAPSPLFYRNKVQFPVANPRGSSRLLAGYYKEDSHDLVNIKHCPVQPEPIDRLLAAVKESCERHAISAYDERTGKGLLRHINARFSVSEAKALLTLVVNAGPESASGLGFEPIGGAPGGDGEDDPLEASPSGRSARPAGNRGAGGQRELRGQLGRLSQIAADVMECVSEVAGVCVNFNPQAGNRILGPETALVRGQAYVTETLSTARDDLPARLREGIRFRLSPTSFFQVNSAQAARLLEAVLDAVGQNQDLVIDAFAGVGTMALWLAPVCRHVIAIEEHPFAHADGLVNRDLNGLTNVEFRLGRVETVIPDIARLGQKPQVIVLDPPRKGVSPSALKDVISLGAGRIVYVSCNPATLARDLRILASNGYITKQIQPVDMFPQTFHVESIAVVEKASG